MSDKNKGQKAGSGDKADSGFALPRDCNPINAVDPYTGKTRQIYVRNSTVALTARKGIGAARELAFTVLETVQKPRAVFRGVTDQDGDDGDDSWLIYVGSPGLAYDHRTGESRKAWQGEVFLVFVDEDWIVVRWRWDEADPNCAHLPANHDAGRFKEKLL